MTTPGLWRLTILVATLFCIGMLFTPLVTEMLERFAEGPGLP